VPGHIKAEDFDNGGEGVAYHDLEPANRGGAYRTGEGVDQEPTTDVGGGYHVGYTRAGEWLEYTVDVTESGTYDFAFRVTAAAAGGKFHLEVDGTNATGSLSVPNTGSSHTWTTITTSGVMLPAGTHVLRLSFDTAASNGALGNFNWFSIRRTSPGLITTILSDSATYVRDGSWANDNFGTTSELLVKQLATGSNRETYIKFDLSSVSAIGSAKLRLYGSLQTTENPAETIGVYATDGDWSENLVTWNTKSSATTKLASFTVAGVPSKWYEVDLTNYIKAEKAAGHATASIALKNLTPANAVCTFWSDELVNGPQLIVTAPGA
jgi:hypothetical protein